MTSVSNATVPPSQEAIDNKIRNDLNALAEKLDLCNSMLRPGGGDPAPSVNSDPTLLSVIGFLEACAPRMVELVEAGSQGALSEAVLMQCLEVNDRLLKCLADIDTVALTETPASTTAASAAPVVNSTNDLLLSDESEKATSTPPLPGAKTTGEEEEIDFFADSKVAAPTTTTEAATSKDEFDSFFAERTSGGNTGSNS